MHQQYKEQGLAVIAIDMGEPADAVRAYKVKYRLSFPHLLDMDSSVAAAFSVQATPTNFLLDRRGRVLGGATGYRDWTTPAAHQLIQHLLKAPAP